MAEGREYIQIVVNLPLRLQFKTIQLGHPRIFRCEIKGAIGSIDIHLLI